MGISTGELTGLRIGVTAERRAHQQVRFLEARGATVLLAPVLETINAAERPQLADIAAAMIRCAPDLLVVQTGQGMRWWLEALPEDQAGQLLANLSKTELWCRGTKAASACRKLGLTVDWQAPNETIADIAQRLETGTALTGTPAIGTSAIRTLDGKRVLIQLDGSSDRELLRIAEDQGATAIGLDVYRYRLPANRGPSIALINAIINHGAGDTVDAVTFTASPQIRHLREMASDLGLVDQVDAAFTERCLAVVVGPVCAETARSVGWTKIVEPPTARLLPMLESLRLALAEPQQAQSEPGCT